MRTVLRIIQFLQIPVALLLSAFADWMLIAVSAVVIGYFAGGNRRESLLVGAYSTIGVILAIVISDQSIGFSQAALFTEIAGIPGGYLLPLILTVTLSFLLGLFAYLLGSSFYFGKKRESEVEEVKEPVN